MTDMPIIFSAPMVRALLDGKKTMTRRVIKPQPVWDNGALGIEDRQGRWVYASNTERDFAEGLPRSRFRMPYAPSDRLWVREAFASPALMPTQYRADPPIRYGHWNGALGPWTPSIHMPRHASRLTLIVTGVKVERLQETSRGDAMEEGCPFPNMAKGDDPRLWYADLWDDLHGDGAWDANPWVVAVSFNVERRNIDR